MRPLPTSCVHLLLMLALTFSTGIVDVVGYLGLDKDFAGDHDRERRHTRALPRSVRGST
jgi:hypothetical protein